MKAILASIVLFTAWSMYSAETPAPIPLWPGEAPGALGNSTNDIPTLTAFLPDATNATGAALVICPGGGYEHLADHEGRGYALWLNQHGMAGFVLRYRLGSAGYRHPIMLQDAARAVRLVRARAQEWGVDPHRVGIMGSSAGGHLASTLLTHFDAGNSNAPDPVDRQSDRPDLGILCYPVITMGQFSHRGSRENLLGTNPPPELIRLLSNEWQVTHQTPPCFIWQTADDNVVSVENSLLFADALRKAKVPFDLHIYEHGRHGLGLDDLPPFLHPHPWASDCLIWLRARNFTR